MKPAENVKTEIKDNQLIITISLAGVTKTPSASGKSMLIATTSGNIRITPSITLGLNVYEPNK